MNSFIDDDEDDDFNCLLIELKIFDIGFSSILRVKLGFS